MAEYVSMKQVPGGTVTAVDDRILNDINLSNGKIYGCDVAYIGNNMIHINAGYGIIKGGLFEIEDHTEYVEYAESEPTTGQIYLKFDASATDKLVIVKETTADLHVLVQNEDANFESGVYEIPICSFVATTTALENVVETWPTASGAMETLATMEALMANTTPGKVADALLTKQINTNLGECVFSVDANGAYVTYTPTGGADSVTKKLGSSNMIGETSQNPTYTGTVSADTGRQGGGCKQKDVSANATFQSIPVHTTLDGRDAILYSISYTMNCWYSDSISKGTHYTNNSVNCTIRNEDNTVLNTESKNQRNYSGTISKTIKMSEYVPTGDSVNISFSSTSTVYSNDGGATGYIQATSSISNVTCNYILLG